MQGRKTVWFEINRLVPKCAVSFLGKETKTGEQVPFGVCSVERLDALDVIKCLCNLQLYSLRTINYKIRY